MRKIDRNLQNFVILGSNEELIECFVYVNDFNRAKDFFKKKDIKIIKEFSFINLICVLVKKDNIFNFEKLSFVNYVNGECKVMALTNVARKILVDETIEENGGGICVAVIDTGISNHFDFCIGKQRIKKFVDLVGGKTKNYDDNGHGTFVSGVLCGNGLISNKKYCGFAPNSDIVMIKALDKGGEANATIILEAMEWVYLHHEEYGIRVVCMSFGSEPTGYFDPIMRAAERLWNSGIVIVAAAGNSGPKYQTIKSPGISSKIITVGGFNDNRVKDVYSENNFEIADFSSRGPALNKIKPDMVAPSVDITSCGLKNNYVTLSGTSVATPMIAGICALILEKYPELKPDQIKMLLLKSCKAITKNFNIEGAGYPQIR